MTRTGLTSAVDAIDLYSALPTPSERTVKGLRRPKCRALDVPGVRRGYGGRASRSDIAQRQVGHHTDLFADAFSRKSGRPGRPACGQSRRTVRFGVPLFGIVV
jgi:hypothetical protein